MGSEIVVHTYSEALVPGHVAYGVEKHIATSDALACKVTAVQFVMLHGAREEVEKEVQVLKVLRAGPLLCWSHWGVLPMQLHFLRAQKEPVGVT